MARPKKNDSASDENLAIDWGARLPKDPEARKEDFVILRDREERIQRAKQDAEDEWDLKGQLDRMTKVMGWHKLVIDLDKKLLAMTPGMRARVWRQLLLRAKDANYDAQPDLFDENAVGTYTPEEGSVFDQTSAGERHDAERTDDPGRARRKPREAAPAPQPSPAMPLDEARVAFEAAAAKKGRKPRSATTEAMGETASAGETHIKQVAEGYFKQQDEKLGSLPDPTNEDARVGNYRVLN